MVLVLALLPKEQATVDDERRCQHNVAPGVRGWNKLEDGSIGVCLRGKNDGDVFVV